jgi:hypothetical protein
VIELIGKTALAARQSSQGRVTGYSFSKRWRREQLNLVTVAPRSQPEKRAVSSSSIRHDNANGRTAAMEPS